MTAKLRIVVFTAGETTPFNGSLFNRLANDPLLDVAAIVVDEYRRKRKPLRSRIVRAIREDGPQWLIFKIGEKMRRFSSRVALWAVDKVHGRRRGDESLSIPIYRVGDIHSDESLQIIRSLTPDLGVIVGGRILKESLITIPKNGTLNIHKRKLPEYRGGGPVGYWEILAGEKSIGVSIHFATRDVDAGPVVAASTIPIEEWDTLESLKLKADIRGVQLYHDAIRRIAVGEFVAQPQDLSRGRTYQSPSDFKVWRLQRQLERKTPSLSHARVLLQFLILMPFLRRVRRELIREQRAPIAIFFYHLVANRPLNHLCLPLSEFARQIEFLRRYYAILSLDEAVERLRSGKNDEIAASITFDDGYCDNRWAIEYLSCLGIPATFFVSIGHVKDNSTFEHDRKRGYAGALPMTTDNVQQLAASGFTIGSHGVHHEDFGSLSAQAAEDTLIDSRDQIHEVCGRIPTAFAFPKGQRGVNITRSALAIAQKHFDSVFSAYGGYSFPQSGRRHFLRISNPKSVFELGLTMAGYTGFRDCLAGNAWGRKTEKLDPCGPVAPKSRVALIAASARISGGHSAQAQALTTALRSANHAVDWIPIDAAFPVGLQWIRRVPYIRTVINELLYLPTLLRIARSDVVHIFAASYWSFLLGPAPAMIAAKLMGKPVVLHYHSGEADDHLRRWRAVVRPLLQLADEIVVPSAYLERVFASHGVRARVIPNCVEVGRFHYRKRNTLRPRLLSARNLEPHYGVDNILRAFALLKPKFPEATLTIAGNGSQERALRALAIDGVRFVGSVASDEMPGLYDNADILLNASTIDNQPVSILEAFASGLPIVSTRTGDIASMLLGGKAGLLVDADSAAIANAVARLLGEPDLALQMARRGREAVERYTWAEVGAEWNALYAQLMSSGAGEVLARGV